jgi:hypothetical protein
MKDCVGPIHCPQEGAGVQHRGLDRDRSSRSHSPPGIGRADGGRDLMAGRHEVIEDRSPHISRPSGNQRLQESPRAPAA